MLNADGLNALIKTNQIKLVVDATHPYAVEVRRNSLLAARTCGIEHVTYTRPPYFCPSMDQVVLSPDHDTAALEAFRYGCPVLITIGTNHLENYVNESKVANVPIVVRVLNLLRSIQFCARIGLTDSQLIVGRGPYNVDENIETIRKYQIGIIVTKDGGREGGVDAKWQAARHTGCKLVVIQRPVTEVENDFCSIHELLDWVQAHLN